MSSEEKPSLDTLIKSWLVAFGEEKFTKAGVPYYFIEFRAYPEALNSLLQSVLAAGYGEDDVDSMTLLRKIQEAMTPEVHDTHKLNDWRDIIAKIWKHFVAKEFANTSLIKPAKNYPQIKSKPKLEIASEAPPVPSSKLDPKKFEGFGSTEAIIDEDFVKMLEALKNE